MHILHVSIYTIMHICVLEDHDSSPRCTIITMTNDQNRAVLILRCYISAWLYIATDHSIYRWLLH